MWAHLVRCQCRPSMLDHYLVVFWSFFFFCPYTLSTVPKAGSKWLVCLSHSVPFYNLEACRWLFFAIRASSWCYFCEGKFCSCSECFLCSEFSSSRVCVHSLTCADFVPSQMYLKSESIFLFYSSFDGNLWTTLLYCSTLVLWLLGASNFVSIVVRVLHWVVNVITFVNAELCRVPQLTHSWAVIL